MDRVGRCLILFTLPTASSRPTVPGVDDSLTVRPPVSLSFLSRWTTRDSIQYSTHELWFHQQELINLVNSLNINIAKLSAFIYFFIQLQEFWDLYFHKYLANSDYSLKFILKWGENSST